MAAARPSPTSLAWRGRRAAKARLEFLQRLPAACGICGRTVWTAGDCEIDHVVPVAFGGLAYDPANLQISHKSCNRAKGAGTGRTNTANRALTANGRAKPKPLPYQPNSTRTHTIERWSKCWFETPECGQPNCRCRARCFPHCGEDDCGGCSRRHASDNVAS